MPPSGFKRSRALWDQARGMGHQNRFQQWQILLRALLYELQPIRFSLIDTHEWLRTGQAVLKGLLVLVSVKVPSWARFLFSFLKTLTKKQWLIAAGVVFYYWTVRWIHNVLEAGPMVLIATALCVIWTVGLGDGTEDGSLSAYSVFNRGFQRLLGSVDENQLLAAHVGGGLGGLGMMNQRNNDDNWRPANRREQPDDDNWRPANRREQEQPPGLRAPQNEPNDADVAGAEDEAERQPANRARASGKKARRRNLEQRREQRLELERQREAAAGMGFGNGPEEEMMAMNRLVEDVAEAGA